jgi:hypothetical protein
MFVVFGLVELEQQFDMGKSVVDLFVAMLFERVKPLVEAVKPIIDGPDQIAESILRCHLGINQGNDREADSNGERKNLCISQLVFS